MKNTFALNNSKNLLYAGIGSRKTPQDVLRLMQGIASQLGEQGFKLRSGAAPGADTAFELGCDSVSGEKEIWLPWKGFNGHFSDFLPTASHIEEAKKYHPVWERLSNGAKRLHSRNVGQVFGVDLVTPVSFVVCWTPDGCEHHNTRTRATGGTGMAISMASLAGIPVFNLANPEASGRLQQTIHGLNQELFEKVYNPHQLELLV